MKNLLYILLMLPALCYGQNFEVTPNGLRDSRDNEKTFLVIEISGTAKQLYDKAVKYINEKMASPKDAIKGQTEGEYLRYNTHASNFINYNNSGAKIPISADFATELKFKDGKVRYEITDLKMQGNKGYSILYSGGVFDGYIIYKKNGTLFKEETKQDIENYFNTEVKKFINYLKSDKNDNW